MSDFVVTPRRLDIVAADADHAERPGLDVEVWARDLPGSPLVQARSRWQDAIDVRTFDPVEVKACRYWHAAAGIEGAWRLRRPQHDRLRERGGYYILVVYKALPAGEKQRRLRIKHAIALTPSAVEARCGSLAWRCTEHDTYGWIRVTDMRWPQLVADAKVSDPHLWGHRDVCPVRAVSVAPRG